MTDSSPAAEQIFLEVYELASEKADYLQPDEARLYLPEWMVSSLATTLIPAALKALFGEVAKDLYRKVKQVMIGGKKLEQCDDVELLKYLAGKIPELGQNEQQFAEAERVVHKELTEIGFSAGNSEVLARRTIEIIRTKTRPAK